ncbi:MAG: ATP-binding protein [Gammaproteobacteria bacterium]|nr:ATP-binding protein [Gammaproteobacteria bacterium]
MLIHPTLDKLNTLRLTGMARAYEQQLNMPDIETISTDERLGLMVDCEVTERESRRLKTRLRRAKLRHTAAIEDIDYRHPRGLDKSLMTKLATSNWVREHNNVLITGPTGIGKSWLACALGHKACRDGLNVLYARVPRFFRELTIARGDGRYPKLMTSLAKTDMLILDDLGASALKDEHRRDLLEILDDRYGVRSTVVTSQFPVEKWHELIADPTLADAILDRLVHNAYKINLKGDSMRKRRKKLTQTGQ